MNIDQAIYIYIHIYTCNNFAHIYILSYLCMNFVNTTNVFLIANYNKINTFYQVNTPEI